MCQFLPDSYTILTLHVKERQEQRDRSGDVAMRRRIGESEANGRSGDEAMRRLNDEEATRWRG